MMFHKSWPWGLAYASEPPKPVQPDALRTPGGAPPSFARKRGGTAKPPMQAPGRPGRLTAGAYSGAPPEPSGSVGSVSGRLSNTLSTIPKAIASSASRKVSRSIAFSISSIVLPVYFA